MESQEKIIIQKYKKFTTIMLSLFAITIGYNITAQNLFPKLVETSFIPSAIALLLLSLFFIMLVIFFIYLYKAATVLHKSGKLKVNPALILIIAILGLPFPIVTIIVLTIIWNKANALIKIE